jgi:hypothetical protein
MLSSINLHTRRVSSITTSLFGKNTTTTNNSGWNILATRTLATIPIKGTSRMVYLKVSGEDDAVKAQDILQKAHKVFKKDVKGYIGSTRFVCKAEWDVYVWYRFLDLDSLKGYMGSDIKSKQIDPILKELEAIAIGKKVHAQNFVADDW